MRDFALPARTVGFLRIALLGLVSLTVWAPKASVSARAKGDPKVSLTPEERAWIKQHPVIRLGVDPEFHPFEFVDHLGRVRGYTSDYVRLLNERLGLNMVVMPHLTWQQATEAVKTGGIDVLPCVGITRERKRYLLFTRAYLEFHRVFVTRRDHASVSRVQDLVGLRVAVQANSSHEGFLRDRTSIKPIVYPTLRETVRAVSEGVADAMVGNVASTTYWIRRQNLTNLKVAGAPSDKGETLHFAVRKDWPTLVHILQKGLNSITRGEKEEISRRWMAVPHEPKVAVDYGPLYRVLLVAGICILIVLVWNFQIRRTRQRLRLANEAALESSERAAAANEKLRAMKGELEDLVRVRSGELAESELKFRTLFETASDAIFLMRADRFIDCNDRTLVMFGCTREQIIGSPPYKYSPPTQPDGRPSMKKALEKIEASMTTGPQRFEWQHCREDRTPFEAEVSLNRVELGDEVLIQAIVRDISERKRIEAELADHRQHLEEEVESRTRELAAAKERAESADRLKSAFLATMSHELRTPLNSVIGFTGILLQEIPGELNPEQRKQLGMVKRSAQHLLALISDVLDISKIEAGQLQVSQEPFDVGESVHNVVSSMEETARSKGLSLTEEVSSDLGQIVGDPRRFEQVLWNLISNAVKFTEEGSVAVRVKRQDSDVVEAVVRDTGIGISPADQAELFQPFHQLDSSSHRKYEGTGLGLSISRRLVELMGGTIWVESEPGVGSRFGFKVPVQGKPESVE